MTDKNYCVNCYNKKICNRYSGDVTQVACKAFIQRTKEDDKYDEFLDNESHTREPGGVDPVTGLEYEYWDVGMVRNAKPENKKRMKVFLKPTPHVIMETQNVPLRGWYKAKYEDKGVRARPCFCDAMLTQPYGGSCPVRCRMCYVNAGGRGWRGQGITVVDPTYPDKIAKQLDKMKYAFGGYISSFTEPFQPVEKVYHNTERLSEAFTSRGLPLFYLSRQVPPEWADNYLLKNKHSYQQYSINTNDRTDYKKLSPGAADLNDLLAKIREQRAKGIYISIQVNPILAGIVSNEQIVSLIHELAKNGANHVIFKFVEIVSPAVPALVREMRKLFPDRVGAFESLFTDTIGGLRTIQESYRINALNLYKEECAKAGITMALCYEYKYERTPEGVIKNKTGISMGREYCTAAQCHGPEFPLYVKNSSGIFEPFNACPPSGCLYCEESTGNNPPCGSKFLAQARALRAPDYNIKLEDLDKKRLPQEEPKCSGSCGGCSCSGEETLPEQGIE